MNRVINLKKPSASEQSVPPVRQPFPRPAPTGPSVRPVTSAVPKPSPLPAVTSSNPMAWHFSFHSDPRVVRNVFGGLVLAAGLSIFLGFYALGAILVLAGIILILHARQEQVHEIAISELGIRIDARTYFFKDLRSFWISYVPGGVQELSFHPTSWYVPHLAVPLEGRDPIRIREFLITYIPEREYPESAVKIILRRVGL